MAHKSNREMRAESLANEKNYERNRVAHKRRKNKKKPRGVNWLVVLVLLVVALYFVKRSGISSLGNPVIRPAASHSR